VSRVPYDSTLFDEIECDSSDDSDNNNGGDEDREDDGLGLSATGRSAIGWVVQNGCRTVIDASSLYDLDVRAVGVAVCCVVLVECTKGAKGDLHLTRYRPDPAQGATLTLDVGGDLHLSSDKSHSSNGSLDGWIKKKKKRESFASLLPSVGDGSNDVLLEALFGNWFGCAEAVAHVSSVLDGWLPRHVVFLSSYIKRKTSLIRKNQHFTQAC